MKTITQVTRRYYKYIQQEQTWTHPNLSSNGTLGGTSFACGGTYSHTSYGTSNIYQLFDGNTGSGITAVAYNGGTYITFYNPEPIKVTSIKNDHIWYAGDWRDVTIYGSDDNSDWTNLGYFNHGLTTACDIANPQYFKYYKLYNNSGFGADGSGYGGGLTELYITASIMDTQIVESDSSDYDFYTDTKEIKCIKEIDRSYYKRIVTEFEQPVLSSNGTMGGDSFAVSGSGTAWYGFDSNEDSCLGQVGTLWFTFYTPEAINLTNLGIRNAGSTYLNFVSGGTIYGSNDNSTWTTLKSFSNSNTSYTWWYVDLSDNTKEFKYHKFVSSGSFGGNSNYLGGVRITGTHTDIVQVLNPQLIERKYYKYDTANPTYNVNITGTLTNNNGVLSGFSSGNFAKLPNTFSHGSKPWEVQFKVTTGSDVSSQSCMCEQLYDGNVYYGLTLYVENNTLRVRCGNGSSIFWNVNTDYSISVNTIYWIKVVFNGTQYILSVSIDGETWTTVSTINSTTIATDNYSMYIGKRSYSSQPSQWLGSIDLKESYIKVNDNYWWEGITYPIIEGTEQDYDFYEDVYNYDFYKDKVYYYTNV